jgi:hypothetical protein
MGPGTCHRAGNSRTRWFAGTTNVAFALSDTIPHSRDVNRPSFAFNSRPRGRRECRAHNAPAASRVIKNKTHEHSHHGHTGITRHSPHNGFTVSFVLSPASPALLPPSSAVCLRQLDTGVRVSGPHDFAVRRLRVRQRAAQASTASRPASVTIASRPLGRNGTVHP